MQLKNLLFISIGIILGEVALVVFTTLAQEVIFDGIHFYKSDNFTLLVGGFLTWLAAILAGMVARIAGKSLCWYIPAGITVLIIVETLYLISNGISSGPLWFEFLAAASLITGIWIGYYGLHWLIRHRKTQQPILEQ